MYYINLNSYQGTYDLNGLIRRWNDDAKVTTSLIVVKVSEAFSMYHQVSSINLEIHHQAFDGLHPVLINDLDTNSNVLLTMDPNGTIQHFYLIDDQGRLRQHDRLRKVAAKTVHQEYLDYFYCIVKNIENYVSSIHT